MTHPMHPRSDPILVQLAALLRDCNADPELAASWEALDAAFRQRCATLDARRWAHSLAALPEGAYEAGLTMFGLTGVAPAISNQASRVRPPDQDPLALRILALLWQFHWTDSDDNPTIAALEGALRARCEALGASRHALNSMLPDPDPEDHTPELS